MKLSEIIKISLTALKRNKVRTGLTILGIVIGITAIIVVMSAGFGVKSYILSQIEGFGTDFIEVEIKVPNTSHTSVSNVVGMVMGVSVTTLKDEDRIALMKLSNIANAYSGVMGQEVVSYLDQNKKAMLFGTTASFKEIDNGEVEFGNYFTESDDEGMARVAVIGSKIREKLFGNTDPLNKNIKINKRNFTVVGVMKERGAFGGLNMDDTIFIPLKTLQKQVLGIDHVTFIFAKMKDASISDETAAEVTEVMREQHDITDPNKEDFAVTTMEEGMQMLDTIIGGITLLLMAIAGISLIVGGVGIMNIMYVIVSERTYEIGLRKAVGATKKQILFQFLTEAIIITFAGGVLGIILGSLISFIISIAATAQGFRWDFAISAGSVFLACGFSIGVGLIFGLYPARKAAELDPIQALVAQR